MTRGGGGMWVIGTEQHTGEFLHEKVGDSGVRDDDTLLTHGDAGKRRDVAKGMDARAGFGLDAVLDLGGH